MKRKTIRMIASTVTLLMILSGCTVTLTGQGSETSSPTGTTMPEATTGIGVTEPIIYESSDYSDLLERIEKMNANLQQQNNRLYKFGGMPALPGATVAMAESADQAAGSNGNTAPFSETNVQVEGVDEADLIKTDGRFLYFIANNRLNIIDAAVPGDMRLAATVKFLSQMETRQGYRGETVLDMYLDPERDRLTLIVTGFDQGLNGQNYTMTLVYSVKDPYNPIEIRRFAQEGSYISSRRIEAYVFVVSQKYQYRMIPFDVLPEGNFEENATREGGVPANATREGAPAASEASEIDPLDIFPSVSETGTTDFKIVKPRQIALIESGDPSSQIIISSLDTQDTAQPAKVQAVLGSSGTVYASTKNLYLFGYQMNWDLRGNWTDSQTEIYRFDLSSGNIALSGQGQVPGTVLNQFSLDEYNGFLRVATTTGQNWGSDQPSKNNLYVLDKNLKTIGSVTGLARNETIRSVRFMGDRGYIVTFRTTDPLFVLDLSKPADPRVVGELKIPGYSAYLHVWGKNRLLGFGYEAAVENDQAFEMGLKVSLFDIADPANPKEISTLLLGSRGSYTELNNNHKVLLSDPAMNILAFPATLAKTTSNSPLEYGQPYFQGLVVMKIVNDRIQLQGGISHYNRGQDLDDPLVPMAEDDQSRFYGYDQVLRGAYIGDVLFTFSNHQIMASRMADLSAIGSIELPGYDEQLSWQDMGIRPSPWTAVEPGLVD